MAVTQEIWKYALQLDSNGNYPVDMPKGAKILTAQLNGGQVCLWAQAMPDAPLETRQFAVHMTGQPLGGNPGNYIGTVQQAPYVWHVFEVTP